MPVQDALRSSMLEAPQSWASKSSPSQRPKEVEALLDLSDQPGSVGAQSEVLNDVHAQVFVAGDEVHWCSYDVHGSGGVLVPSEIHHNLFESLNERNSTCTRITAELCGLGIPGLFGVLYVEFVILVHEFAY